MNSNFHEKLNKFVIIYVDDILVYSKSMEEHVTHLEFVLQKFKENKLYVIQAKNKFARLEMDFLEHVLSCERVTPNPKKIESIKEWQSSNSTKGIKYLLRLTNLYKKFIKDFSALGKPPIDLLKKKGSFELKDEQ
jgi:hypothetical protein